MSSRRRLDISSLLCDNNEETSASKADIQLSRSALQSREAQLDAQQALDRVSSSSYSPNEQGTFAFPGISGPYDNPRYESILQHQRGLHKQQQQGLRSLPSATDLVPLALQPSPPRRRTPSPPYSLPAESPKVPTEHLGRGRSSDGGSEVNFPRPGSFSAQPHTQGEGHPHRYSQFPHPLFSTSPVNIHQSSHSTTVRRSSAQFSRQQYSPISLTHPSLSPLSPNSLPSRFSTSTRPLSISPTDLSQLPRSSTSSSSERPFLHSPTLTRHPEERMYTSHRTSASLSPTAPTSGLTGLDVLVQAATEERERIDVHRKHSGGEESNPLQNFAATARPPPLSPVVPRSEVLQVPPPTPPYTASSQTIGYLSRDHIDAYYNEQSLGENIRRRPSAEPATLPPTDASQASHYGYSVASSFPESISGRRSHSPEAGYVDYESQTYGPGHESRVSVTSASRHVPMSKPRSLYASSPSTHTGTQRTSFEDEGRSTSSHFPSMQSPVESPRVPYARRSPPRSRPKPRKPGSAALASMEKESVASAIERSTSKHSQKPNPSHPQAPKKLPNISSRARQSNERGALDDEDVDDFFLSTFDSPRNSERQIPSQKTSTMDTPSVQSRGSEHWNYAQSRRTNVSQSSQSPARLSSSPFRTNESPEYFSPVRGAFDRDDEETMSDVEAEILDELADAAGAATSEAERTDFDDAETDNMEVDVESELLSLIDGPAEPHSKSYHHSKHPLHSKGAFTAPQNPDIDETPMTPTDAVKVTGVKEKDTKKGAKKLKGKGAKAPPGTVKATKGPSAQILESSLKPSKSKTASKPRPTKGLPSEKAKGAKASKEPLTPISTSLQGLAEFTLAPGTPTDDAFPVVTSSGRMVTKSKKSAAAANVLTNQSSASHPRKKTAVQTGDGGPSRSRSHSVMPRASADPELHRERTGKEDEEKVKDKDKDATAAEVDDGEKDKLYCICRTQYDEDRVMIACDRCDEWYHTQCVDMPDLLVDLVDQFICTNCIAQNPSLNLQTTYKQRCFSGLKHPNPDSPDACHKASRGAYSKYCSDECGVSHMHRRIQCWASNGGDVRSLWESTKDAKRREGFVTHVPGRTLPTAILAEIQNNGISRPQGTVSEVKQAVVDEEGKNSIVARLDEQLQIVVREREEIKKQLEVLSWRERLLQLASDRAESMGDCGWDQRLVYGDEEWLEFGAGVLESYEDAAPNGHSEEALDMDVDGQTIVGEWWCRGKKKCERHMGWQRVRAADMEMERSTKEGALADLTTREREIRSRIEDIMHPQLRPTGSFSEATLKFKLGGSDGGGKKFKKKPATAGP